MKAKARKFRGYSPERKVAGEGALWKKVGVDKGFGPRHAANAKEGDLTQVNTDTVPAMLTPREAVLNRNAAELAGRGKIEALNAEGNKLAKRGVDLAQEGEDDVPFPARLPLEGADAVREETQAVRDKWMEDLYEALRARGVPPLRGFSEGEESKDTGHALPGYTVLAQGGTRGVKGYVGGSGEVPPWETPEALPSPTPQHSIDTNPSGNTYYDWLNSIGATTGAIGGGGGGLEVRNELGYNPSYPYGSFGSGVPTRKAFGALGNILGGGVLGAAVPGVGNVVGGAAGGKFGSWLGKLFNNWRMNRDVGGSGSGDGTGTTTDDTGTAHISTSGGGLGRGDKWHDIFGPRSSASGIPGVGVGIGPTGRPAVGREWWSPDFGRWGTGAEGFGPGGPNTAGGPGLGIGTLGTGFGSGTVGNFYTAIGLDRLGAGSGASNLRSAGGGWGDDARPHFNPFYGGYSADKMAGGPGVKLRAQGDSDVEKLPPGAWGNEPTIYERLRNDFGPGGDMDRKHIEDVLHLLAQFGAPTEKPVRSAIRLLGQPISNEEMMRRYPGLKFQKGTSDMKSKQSKPKQQGHSKGGFYPPGQGMFASGTGDVGIGDPDPQSIGGNYQMPDLTAPNLGPLVAALMAEGKKQGLSAGQMQSILGVFQGMGGGGGMASYGEGSSVSNALGPALEQAWGGGYQGGISDIGYPPFAAPNAEYHADKGSTWIGPYDPNIMIPRY